MLFGRVTNVYLLVVPGIHGDVRNPSSGAVLFSHSKSIVFLCFK